MKVKNRKTGEVGYSSKFNVAGVSSEVIVAYNDSFDLEFISDLYVYIEAKREWVDMPEAFRLRLIIPDNCNEFFRAPKSVDEFIMGWY